jgi:two-component system response regulator AtoC
MAEIGLRNTGISVVGDMPWGTHFCHFYDSNQDLLDTLVPYFKAGLEDKEFCIWVIAAPLTKEEARNALQLVVPDLDRHFADRSIEMFLGEEWYLENDTFNLDRVTNAWNKQLKQALARGYEGMRVSSDRCWLRKKDWQDFCAYEDHLNKSISNRAMTVWCTYQLAKSGAAEILDVARTHQFCLARRSGNWEVIETPEIKLAKQEMRKLNEELERRVDDRTDSSFVGTSISSEDGEPRPLPRVPNRKFGFDQIVGQSPVLQEMLRLARKVAESEVSSVLLQGESGTGKDLVAKAIHYASKHADHSFIAINCAVLPSNLIESELFGYEKGAFTDARARKAGLLEQANGDGTVFLDEISELDINLQAKLLRVLEEGSFRRVGGLKDVSFSARVIAASNRDLKLECGARRFRLDLYYRLAIIQLDIPRLSERGDDVLLLAQHFIDLNNTNGRQKIKGFTPEALTAFRLYDWPGNVRELRNVIERAMILEDGDIISTRYLPREIVPKAEASLPRPVSVIDADRTVNLPRQGISLNEVETSLLKQALAQAGGNQTRAADLLGLTRDQFRYRLKKLRELDSSPRLRARAAALC